MLKDNPTHTTLPCSDLDRARAWYAEKLGVEPSQESPAGLTYEGPGGSRYFLFQSGGAPSGEATQMGWRVKDIVGEVKELKTRGVHFEDYDFPGFDHATSVAQTGPIQSAWFKDSEGNLIGIVQLPEE
jgi:catechol 2,3-dioxygenase-like lactoylglutathione lyase family enzyme